MQSIAKTAVAYIRTSSAANVGPHKDSAKRQTAAIRAYAKAKGLKIVRTYTDEAVSGADHIEDREGFVEMLDYMLGNGARVILLETASRFARDVMVQEAVYRMLKAREIKLVPVDSPEHFEDDVDNPTRKMVRQILGVVSEFEKASLVQKLRKARDRKSKELGRRIEGPKVPPEVVKAAKRLARLNPKTHKRRSLRGIAGELAALGHLSPSQRAYGPESIKRMIGR